MHSSKRKICHWRVGPKTCPKQRCWIHSKMLENRSKKWVRIHQKSIKNQCNNRDPKKDVQKVIKNEIRPVQSRKGRQGSWRRDPGWRFWGVPFTTFSTISDGSKRRYSKTLNKRGPPWFIEGFGVIKRRNQRMKRKNTRFKHQSD